MIRSDPGALHLSISGGISSIRGQYSSGHCRKTPSEYKFSSFQVLPGNWSIPATQISIPAIVDYASVD
jgi:hypothetical protein